MSVTEAPPSTATAVAAEKPGDVRLAQLEARVDDLDRRVRERPETILALRTDRAVAELVRCLNELANSVPHQRWPWQRHRAA